MGDPRVVIAALYVVATVIAATLLVTQGPKPSTIFSAVLVAAAWCNLVIPWRHRR